MEYTELEKLANEYHIALLDEQSKARIAAAETAVWYNKGTITGKNDQARKAQEAGLVADNQAHIMLQDATANRKRLETLIGLTKAWLYSQGGVS